MATATGFHAVTSPEYVWRDSVETVWVRTAHSTDVGRVSRSMWAQWKKQCDKQSSQTKAKKHSWAKLFLCWTWQWRDIYSLFFFFLAVSHLRHKCWGLTMLLSLQVRDAEIRTCRSFRIGVLRNTLTVTSVILSYITFKVQLKGQSPTDVHIPKDATLFSSTCDPSSGGTLSSSVRHTQWGHLMLTLMLTLTHGHGD